MGGGLQTRSHFTDTDRLLRCRRSSRLAQLGSMGHGSWSMAGRDMRFVFAKTNRDVVLNVDTCDLGRLVTVCHPTRSPAIGSRRINSVVVGCSGVAETGAKTGDLTGASVAHEFQQTLAGRCLGCGSCLRVLGSHWPRDVVFGHQRKAVSAQPAPGAAASQPLVRLGLSRGVAAFQRPPSSCRCL